MFNKHQKNYLSFTGWRGNLLVCKQNQVLLVIFIDNKTRGNKKFTSSDSLKIKTSKKMLFNQM